MEAPPPTSPIKIPPDSSATTPVTPTFPDSIDTADVEQRSKLTEVELARQNATSQRHRVYTLLIKLSAIQQRLSSDLGYEHEENNLYATRQWANEINDIAWDVVVESARLIEDVEWLMLKLEEERGWGEEEMVQMQWVLEQEGIRIGRVLERFKEEDEGEEEDEGYVEEEDEDEDEDVEGGENRKEVGLGGEYEVSDEQEEEEEQDEEEK